jgi:ribonuclease Z
MSCVISVLAVDNAFHSPAIVVTTETSRFLFDVGEGAQRLVMEHKVRVGKVRAVLATSAHIRCLGGLTGMLLTLGDAGVGKLDVLGPVGIQRFMAGVKNFTRPLDNFYTPQIDAKSNLLAPYVTKDLIIIPVALGLPTLPLNQCRHFCYIGETPQIPGKFFVEKAQELGVPKGPIFGKLKNGFAVTLPDGRIVEPWQVLGEPTLSQSFVIIPCLTIPEDEMFLQFLFQEPALQKFQEKRTISDVVQLMVHLSPRETVCSVRYESWMVSFGTETKHIFVGAGMSKESSQTSYIAERLYNRKLSTLYPSMFPRILGPDNLVEPRSVANHTCPSTVLLDEQRISGEIALKYVLLPVRRAGLDRSDAVLLPCSDVDNSEQDIFEGVDAALLQRAFAYNRDMTRHIVESSDIENVRFFFLGTGCAIPSKYRNVSSTLVYLHVSRSAMLFDCGEGTWHQLLRLTPPTLTHCQSTSMPERAQEWARLVKLVWISHLHADHHLGLVHLILQRSKRLSISEWSPLFIIAPMYVLRFLEEVSGMMPEIVDGFVGIPSNCFDPTDLLCTECKSEDSIIAQLQRNTLESSVVFNASLSTTMEPEESGTNAENQDREEEKEDSMNAEELLRKRRKVRDFRYRPRVITSSTSVIGLSPTSSTAAVSSTFLASGVDGLTTDPLSLTSTNASTAPTGTRVIMSMISNAFREVKQLLVDMGIVELINVPVIHCIQANGLVLTVRKAATGKDDDGVLKIVYSGDTRPSETLIFWGQDANILLHEATFEDDKISEAVHKKHSTINEAVEVARLMHVPHLILTHFSQRYHGIPMQFHPQYPHLLQLQESIQQQDVVLHSASSTAIPVHSVEDIRSLTLTSPLPVLSATSLSAVSNVVVAFDFMTVSDRELTWAKGMTPLLAEIFPALPIPGEEDDDLIEKEDIVGVEGKN